MLQDVAKLTNFKKRSIRELPGSRMIQKYLCINLCINNDEGQNLKGV